MSQGDCFTPIQRDTDSKAQREHLLDAHRAVRYDGLLQLIDEVQRRRSIADVAKVVAARWKHCANVSSWRLLCVYARRGALVESEAGQARVTEMALEELAEFDRQTWAQRVPHHWVGNALQAQHPGLPAALADARGVALSVLPVQQGTSTIGILSVLSFEKPFDNLDRKFNALVAGAMATRILSILTEQSLTADLMQAQRQLLEQRQANIMGRLVNGVAHEINTPLGVQIASCDVLASMVADPGQLAQCADDIQETIALIDQQARRAARIVKRLKQISAASVTSPKLATSLHDELGLIAQGYPELDIRTDCPVDLQLTLDRHALGSVLGELLDNARAHGASAGGHASVRLSAQEEGGHITIRVTDQGAGIAPEQLAHFSDPFFTSKQNQGHIGIGGYIAHNVARDALGATLELQTQAGQTSVALHFSKA